MGLGPIKNGRQLPITPYAGSWAEQEAKRRADGRPIDWMQELRYTQPSVIRQPDLTLKPSKHRGD